MWGAAPALHSFAVFLQASKKVMTSEGSVAHFTSVKPFPQAEDETSHMKAKTAVTNRSLTKTERKNPNKILKTAKIGHDIFLEVHFIVRYAPLRLVNHTLCTVSFTQVC